MCFKICLVSWNFIKWLFMCFKIYLVSWNFIKWLLMYLKIYFVSWNFIKWLFMCFKINKLKNLRLTILSFWLGSGSYLYYSILLVLALLDENSPLINNIWIYFSDPKFFSFHIITFLNFLSANLLNLFSLTKKRVIGVFVQTVSKDIVYFFQTSWQFYAQ